MAPPYWTNIQIATAAQVSVAVVDQNWPYLGSELIRWGFNSKMQCIGAIGTVAHEAGFAPVREAWYLNDRAAMDRWYADTTKHAPYSGGINYHGRGLIQTTHDYNYKAVQEALAARGVVVDLLANPDLLLDIKYAAPAFCKYWSDHPLCQTASEAGDWTSVRRAVFGGNDPVGTARIKYAADRLRG